MTALLSLLASLVDFSGSLVVAAVASACFLRFLRGVEAVEDLDAIRLRLAAGLVFALSVKTGAGLLRTITAASWHQVGWLLSVVGLRFFLGRVLKRAETAGGTNRDNGRNGGLER
jgi:uncharacterized membrane protein